MGTGGFLVGRGWGLSGFRDFDFRGLGFRGFDVRGLGFRALGVRTGSKAEHLPTQCLVAPAVVGLAFACNDRVAVGYAACTRPARKTDA